MEWLVVAEGLIAAHDSQPILAAAMAEHMPLPPRSVEILVSLDVIEHVRDPARYLSEIDRVLKPGGRVALSTPNRFSLTAEPHVFVWGVGWMPRRWQKRYVQALSGKSYDDTCLLSYWKLRRLIRKHTHLCVQITPGTVSDIEIGNFAAFRSKLARLYNQIHRWPALRWLFRVICPFFQISGTKRAAGLP